MTFKQAGLKPELLHAIKELGYETPTPIQQQSIPFLLESTQDLVALAQTGTGKTAAFSLPVLNQIDTDVRQVQALILCPTRELCLQIAKDIEGYSTQIKGLSTVAVYGGASPVEQKRAIKKGAQIVVGTPGRTLDLIKQRALKVNQIDWLVLDEADEMLNMGFQKDLEAILATTSENKQTLLFSATMPKSIEGMVKRFMDNPHRIQVAKQNVGSSDVEHQYYVVKDHHRYAALQRLIDSQPSIYGIVFCRTRKETQQIADKLLAMNYNADTIHGDLSQSQRDRVMKAFKNRTLQILVATDVAARGIDVDVLTHVINYRLPDDPEVYVHRSGRTGRAGNQGVSICLVNPKESRRIKELEKMIGKKFSKKQVPSGEDIGELRLRDFIQNLKRHNPKKEVIGKYQDIIEEEMMDMHPSEMISRLLSMQINRFLEQESDALDLNATESKEKERSSKNKPVKNWQGYLVNAGKKQNMNPKRLISLINEQTDSNDIQIGDILVNAKSTYFEIDAKEKNRLEEAFAALEMETGTFIERTSQKPNFPARSGRSGRSKSGGKRRPRKQHR